MQKRKSTLVVIIVLLVFFVPLAIGSTFLHFKYKDSTIENPNQDFLYNGKLYFYQAGILLGTYTCNHTDYCDYAVSRNNDFLSVLEHQEKKMQKIELLNNRYAFLMDTTITLLNDAEIILYDLKEGKELGRYKEVKNYGIGINNNIFLVKNRDDLWGAIEFSTGVNVLIPFEYDYIALSDRVDASTNKIVSDVFSVLKDEVWYLVDKNNTKVSEELTETIASYNETSIVTTNGTTMRILNYQGNDLLIGNYLYINYCGPYIAIVDENHIFYVYDLVNNKEVGNRHNVTNIKDLSFEVTKQYVRVSLAGEIIENIAIR